MKTTPNVAATEKAAARLAKIQAMLRAAKAQEAAAIERQAQIVGRALIAEMRLSAAFKKTAGEVLRRTVTKSSERAEIAVLLVEIAP